MLFEFTLSAQREDFYDVTPQVREAVAKSGVASGLAVVYCPHTTAGMTINENADPDPKGIEVTDDELANVKLKPHDFHGEWNYTVPNFMGARFLAFTLRCHLTPCGTCWQHIFGRDETVDRD